MRVTDGRGPRRPRGGWGPSAALPAPGALSVAPRMSVALVVASALGIVAGAGGYLVAYFECFPVGASQCAVAGLLAAGGLALRRSR